MTHRLILFSICFLLWHGPGKLAVGQALQVQTLNQVLGLELFQDPWLWDDSAVETAGRLKWPKESETTETESYRLYPRPGLRVLQTRPYSLALYGRGTRVERLSLVFANRGDHPGFRDKESYTRQAIQDFRLALERDMQLIQQQFTHLFGPPQRQSYGDGNIRERVWRWDWNQHAFLLRSQQDAHVALTILPSSEADQAGRASKTVSDGEIRKILRARVERRPNGDVIITDIPMVDQGPKGYCGPATWERYLRYLGIPADMYILANAAQARPGGGTNPDRLAASVYSYVRQFGRKPRPIRGSTAIKYIHGYIDEGLPIMWNMVVEKNLNRLFSIRSNARKKIENPADWRRVLETGRQQSGSLPWEVDEAHTCMIIGYNSHTNEICISDSWGSRYAERWITEEEAAKISLGSLSIVQW